jgi:hypothetical protein
MRNRRELRTTIKLAVRVYGMDSTGKLFSVDAHTVDITAVSACIEGDLQFLQRGSVVGVQCGRSRSRFRVAWSNGDHIGVHCVELGKYIWGIPLERKLVADSAGSGEPAPLLDRLCPVCCHRV